MSLVLGVRERERERAGVEEGEKGGRPLDDPDALEGFKRRHPSNEAQGSAFLSAVFFC